MYKFSVLLQSLTALYLLFWACISHSFLISHFKVPLTALNMKTLRQEPFLWHKKGVLDLLRAPHNITPSSLFCATSDWSPAWLMPSTEQQQQTGKHWFVTEAKGTDCTNRGCNDLWYLCTLNWTENPHVTQTLQTADKRGWVFRVSI